MLRQAGIIASSITGMLRAIAYYRMSSPSPETPSSGVRRCFLLLASLVVVVAPVLIWIIQFCALSWNRLKLRGCVGSGEGPATSEAITLNAVTMSLTLPLTTVVNVGGYSGLLWKTWQRDRQRRNMGQRRILRRDILFEIFLLTALCFPMNVIDIWCAIKDENIAHRFISSVLFVVFAVSLATKISIYQPDSNQGSSNSNIIDIMRCETKHDDIQEKTTDSSDKRNNIIENQSLRLETFNRIEHSDNKHIVVVSSNCPSEDNESFVSVKATHKMTYRLDSGDMTPRPDCEHLDCLDIDRASVCSGRKTGARCPILQSPDGSPVNAIPIHRASTTSRLSVISCLGDNNIPGQQERHTSVFSIAKYCHSDLSCVQDEVPEKKHRPSFSGSLVSDTTIPMKRLWMNYAIGDVDLLWYISTKALI